MILASGAPLKQRPLPYLDLFVCFPGLREVFFFRASIPSSSAFASSTLMTTTVKSHILSSI